MKILGFYNNNIITHNDSGGQANLYEINASTGAVLRTVAITNATNVDWEDIAQDALYIYIGDIGNNFGNRTDLKYIKFRKKTTMMLMIQLLLKSYPILIPINLILLQN
jgi:hypothetical protein